MHDPRKILVVMAGAPGSGKSTVAEDVADRYGLAIVCPDKIRAELFGDEGDQSEGWRVFQIAYERMRGSLSDPCCPGAIFDATNCRRRARRDVLAQADGFYPYAICAVAATDLATCLERNAQRARHVPEDVVENMHASLWNLWPGTDEGFDEVVDAECLDEALAALF